MQISRTAATVYALPRKNVLPGQRQERPGIRFGSKGMDWYGSPYAQDPGAKVTRELQDVSRKIVIERNRELARTLRNTAFYYGNARITALDLLEVIYNRDQNEPEKRLARDILSQLHTESESRRNDFKKAMALLEEHKVLAQKLIYSDSEDYSELTKEGSRRHWRWNITSLGNELIEQCRAEQAQPAKSESAPESAPAPAPEREKNVLSQMAYALLEKTSWGVTGHDILKEMHKQQEGRSWLAKWWKPGLSADTVKTLLKARDADAIPLNQLSVAGMLAITYGRTHTYTLTDKGKAAAKSTNLWQDGILTAEDMKSIIEVRLVKYQENRKELDRLLGEFESATEKILGEYDELEVQMADLNREARQAYVSGKDEALSMEEREVHRKSALSKKQAAKAIETDLRENRKPLLEQALYQLELARQFHKKMSLEVNERLRQAQQQQVLLKLAVIENNLGDFATQWAANGAQPDLPLLDIRQAIEQKWSGLDINFDPGAIQVQKELEKLRAKKKEDALAAELEAEVREETSDVRVEREQSAGADQGIQREAGQ